MTAIQAAVTAIVAVAALVIAWRQYQTARAKLRLDLYDKRYQVYLALVEFIDDLQGRVIPDAEYTAHVRKLEQMQFLFDKPVDQWVRGLLRDARSMNNARRINQRAQNHNPENIPKEDISEANRTYHRLTSEFDKYREEAVEMFLPYLDFRKNL